MSLSYFIRADGIADLPFRALLVSNVVNIIFDLIFIGVFKLGIPGAAWATIIAQTLSALACLIKLFMMKDIVKLVRKGKRG